MIKSLQKGDKVKAITDQFVNHTLADDLAENIFALLDKEARGVFHVAGADRLSRYEFAMQVVDFFGFDKDLVIPVTSKDMGWDAQRPLNGGLTMSKLNELGIWTMSTKEQLEVVERTFVNLR